MNKIAKLTAAQESRLVEFREEWLQVGLCCKPADFATGDEIIRGFYARLKKPAPLILHFSSPAMCELAVNFVFALLKDGQLSSQLYSQLDSQLDSQLRSQLNSQLDSQLSSLKPYFLNNRWGAQHWCSWEAFYIFWHEIGVKYKAENMALLLEWGRLSNSVGWWAPWDGICFVSDRPRFVSFDNNARLHCENGMAVKYSDGWGVHAWRGVAVPESWIENKGTLTAAMAISWKNIEQRRSACEILGWSTILRELNAKTIDRDSNPEIGELVEVELPDIGRERFMRVRCATGRDFAIPVPPATMTALEGQAFMWGIEPHKFKLPEVRT